MVVGFNHNFRYKGEVYHIQTEDGGRNSPNIVTLLYRGGTILASKKTSYADIARVDNLEQVVEELMKEQHKDMLRKLKSGDYDAAIERFEGGRKGAPIAEVAPAVTPKPEAVAPQAPAAQPEPAAAAPKPAAAQPKPRPEPSPAVETSLDEIILSYLIGDEK